MFDHGLLYGDGVFEGIRFYNHCPFRLEAHLERLTLSTRAIALRLPYGNDELADAVKWAIAAFGQPNGYLRLVVTRGVGPMGLDPRGCTRANVFVIADELHLVSTHARQRGVSVVIANIRRLPADGLDPRIKSLNYLNNILARIEANCAGVDEAVLLNIDDQSTPTKRVPLRTPTPHTPKGYSRRVLGPGPCCRYTGRRFSTRDRRMPASKRPSSAAKPRRYSRTRTPEDLDTQEWQVALRRQYGREQAFRLENLGDQPVFSEFAVHNPHSGRTYRVAIRGADLGVNYCACPDFATNLLGTCKHIEFVLGRLERRRGGKAALRRGFEADYSEVYLRYGAERHVCFRPGRLCTPALLKRARVLFDADDGWRLPAARLDGLEDFLGAARRSRHELRCYDDALAFIAERRADAARSRCLAEAFPQGAATPVLRDLLTVPLYPYQCEGALFAARAGRAIIADDMGLGKTVQAIATALMFLRHLQAERVLVVCPTSLKHQWHEEIARLTGQDALVVGGPKRERERQFAQPATFKITNYDTVRRDLDLINAWVPDLVIADEAQRIKNWDTKAARAIKQIKSRYALVLTGTPLDNRLRELLSIVQFVDQHRLGPTWRFLERHQITADSGQVVGYRHLDEVATTLAPILIRRRKAEVLDQLPPLTAPQKALHEEHAETVARIVARWKRQHFLSDRDQKILMAALQNMRMVCDSTYLLDPSQDHGSKIPELLRVLEEVLADREVKVVIFSQWLRSHELLSRALEAAGWQYVLFHGGVPARRRGALVRRFKTDPDCRVFLSTDAGGVGLNLQCASVVMNLDLPWNPAVLEQRIGRAHRLGQHRSVQVLHFVAEASIEHNLLGLLEFKQSLAAGILDGGDKEVHLGGSRLARFMESVERATAQPAAEPPPPAHADAGMSGATDESAVDASVDDSAAASVAGDDAKPDRDPWQPLLAFAHTLLTELAQQPEAGKDRSSGGMLRRDPQTGERYLHLPVPDQDKVARLLDALRDLLAGD